MEITNCIQCGKLCAKIPSRLCPQCLQKYLDDEIKVAEFLRENENSTVDEVYYATKVEKHIIIKMIKEGRIIEGTLSYACENCGAAISVGRFCKPCAEELERNLTAEGTGTAEEEQRKGGMFITETLEKLKKEQ